MAIDTTEQRSPRIPGRRSNPAAPHQHAGRSGSVPTWAGPSSAAWPGTSSAHWLGNVIASGYANVQGSGQNDTAIVLGLTFGRGGLG